MAKEYSRCMYSSCNKFRLVLDTLFILSYSTLAGFLYSITFGPLITKTKEWQENDDGDSWIYSQFKIYMANSVVPGVAAAATAGAVYIGGKMTTSFHKKIYSCTPHIPISEAVVTAISSIAGEMLLGKDYIFVKTSENEKGLIGHFEELDSIVIV